MGTIKKISNKKGSNKEITADACFNYIPSKLCMETVFSVNKVRLVAFAYLVRTDKTVCNQQLIAKCGGHYS